jgi:S1-C subfamily serine protease
VPEDPGPDGPGRAEGEGPDDPDAPQRGWVHPDDRVWRHPSEQAAGPPDASVRLEAPPRHRWRAPAMVAIGVVAVMAVVAWVVLLLSPASDHPMPSATSNTAPGSPRTAPGTGTTVPTAADAVGKAIVELRAGTTHGDVTLFGIAVAEGGVVVTAAEPLRGAVWIDMVGSDGRLQRASIAATDGGSDVALVDVPVDVPVAAFSDDSSLAPGTPALTLGFVPYGSAGIALRSYGATVASVAGAIESGPARGLAGITAHVVGSGTPGEPLLDDAGHVVGVLCNPATATFLPGAFVLSVADDLRSNGRVSRGILGVEGANALAGPGAVVETVSAHGPLAGRLRHGEVIVAIDGQPVRSMAELSSRLYTLAPGTGVQLSVENGTQRSTVSATLAPTS